MSQLLRAEEFMELLSCDMVAINIGERKISVYQSLLDSVTDTFKKAPVPIDFGAENRTRSFELPVEDMGTFQMFLLWLYSANRCRQMEDYDTDSLIDLYVFGISLRCESLKADALHSLRRVLDENAPSADLFFQALNSRYNRTRARDHDLQHFHLMLDDISKAPNIDGHNINTWLELYVKSLRWGNHNWQNWIINSIRDELDGKRDVLIFEQIKFVFDGTRPGDPLRKFCTALAYYQRRWVEGPIKSSQKLEAGGMMRRLNDIRGFMGAYLNFEDDHRDDFPAEPPKDPRDRNGEMGPCYFHFHKNGESCTLGMDLDEDLDE